MNSRPWAATPCSSTSTTRGTTTPCRRSSRHWSGTHAEERVVAMLYKTLPGFLGPQLRDELLAYAQAHESSFEDTAVGQTLEVVKSIRMSRRLNDLGRFRKEIEDRVLALTP